MEILCPECMSSLAVLDGKWVKCAQHGQRYEILFLRPDFKPQQVGGGQQQSTSLPTSNVELGLHEEVPTQCPHCGQKYKVSAKKVGNKVRCGRCHSTFQIVITGQSGSVGTTSSDPGVSSQAGMCARHPKNKAKFTCADCGAAICEACDILLADAEGTHLCPQCAYKKNLIKTIPDNEMRTPQVPAGRMCVQHPSVWADHTCALCGSPICKTCEFPQTDGTHLCPDCVTKKQVQTKAGLNLAEIKSAWQNESDEWVSKAVTTNIDQYPPEVAKIIQEEAIRRGLITQEDMKESELTVALVNTGQAGSDVILQPAVPVGQFCVQHPEVQAVQMCKVCGSAMCATCDFVFPGNIHLCPTCATSPQKGLKGKRRTYLTWSYILGVESTLATLFFVSGAAVKSVGSDVDAEALGLVMTFTMLIPAVIGTALGCSAMERHSKPASVWVATLWNGALVAVYILLIIIGLTMG
jgi:predicted Zn finger-like uncharacterized protein